MVLLKAEFQMQVYHKYNIAASIYIGAVVVVIA